MKKLPAYRFVIVAIVCLLAFISNYIQFQISALAYVIMPALNLSTAEFSSLLLAPMLVAVFFSIPSGALGDRIGAKKVVSVGCIISVIGAFGRIIATNFALMMLMLLACGIFISILNANLIKILGIWFQEETEKAIGYFFAAACMGIVVSQMTGTLFPSVNSAYIASSVALLIGSVLWIAFVKDCPEGMSLPKPEPVVKYLKHTAKSKNTWIISIAAGFGLASSTAYAGILPQALTFAHGVNASLAGTMAAIITVGSFLGSIIGPIVCNKLGKYKPFLIVTTIIGAAIMFYNWYSPAGIVMWIVLILNGFFTAVQGPTTQALPFLLPEIGDKYAGSAGGILGTVSLLMSYFIPIVISSIVKDNYALNLGIESVIFLLAVICYFFIPELGRKGKPATSTAEKTPA
ncbi:MFS transporter [Bacillus sp. JJ1764]|uniref:MFS transporter n=1 Tax=Bacillus sp. JJ1764 TaxID=3122964 RepID=UPI003000E401